MNNLNWQFYLIMTLAMIALSLDSCKPDLKSINTEEEDKARSWDAGRKLYYACIDGVEYIYIYTPTGGSLTHHLLSSGKPKLCGLESE